MKSSSVMISPDKNVILSGNLLFEAFISPVAPFTGRIVFPIRDITGKIVAFNGRILGKNITNQPKYIFHPPRVKLPMFPTNVKPIKGRVILVEGIYDVINLHDKGLTNVCCCFGTNNINEDKLLMLSMVLIQLELIKQYKS